MTTTPYSAESAAALTEATLGMKRTQELRTFPILKHELAVIINAAIKRQVDNSAIAQALKAAREKLEIVCGGQREYVGGLPTQVLFPMIDAALEQQADHIVDANKMMQQAAPGVAGEKEAAWCMLPPELNERTKLLVGGFATALAEKLYQAELKYGYSDGWANADWMDECREKLMEHVAKGDPRDVAAYCAFLWWHDESTASQPHPTGDTQQAACKTCHGHKITSFENLEGGHDSGPCPDCGDTQQEAVSFGDALKQSGLGDYIKAGDATHTLCALEFYQLVSRTPPEATALAQQVERLKALSVENIMLKVVPGEDGMGEEVYAKSVDEVVALLTAMNATLNQQNGKD